jgi:hypothetical protein
LLYKIFGNQHSKVWQTPYMALLYKGVMGITICGAAANIITLSTPSWSEILLNLGASGNWLFLSFYLYGYTSYTKPSLALRQRSSSSKTGSVLKRNLRPKRKATI